MPARYDAHAMTARPWDRERVLALIWLAGALLTGLTIVLPYDAEVDDAVRGAIGAAALVCGLALLVAPPLPDRVLHANLVLGTLLISVCTSLGEADIEGVMYLLPVLFAFAAFRPSLGAAHLALASASYAVVLATAAEGHTRAPWISVTLVMGVGAVTGAAIALIEASRERAVEAGARDRRIAAVLQRSLLPGTLPCTPGVELAARYVPAAEEADVGGDLYDVLALPRGCIAITIGDVAGKGLPAAAMVGRTRSALRAYALDDPAPARVLDRLNRLMVSDPTPARMTTLLYAVLDTVSETLTWSSAGHLPPLVVPAEGEARYLEGAGGMPLGVMPLARYGEDSVRLEPGDRLLLFTDGLVERRAEPLDDGLTALARRLEESPGVCVDALIAAALDGVPSAQRDDVAVLAVSVTALGDHLELELPSRPESLADLRVALRRWGAPRLQEAAVEDLLLAGSEVAANAIVHAGPLDSVSIEALAGDGRVVLRVRDRGHWRAEVDDDFGNGLALARALSDRLEVRPGPEGTLVELELRGDRAGVAATGSRRAAGPQAAES